MLRSSTCNPGWGLLLALVVPKPDGSNYCTSPIPRMALRRSKPYHFTALLTEFINGIRRQFPDVRNMAHKCKGTLTRPVK